MWKVNEKNIKALKCILTNMNFIAELSSQLSKLREENDCSLATIQSIETELEDLRLKNAHLREDLLKKSGQNSSNLQKT